MSTSALNRPRPIQSINPHLPRQRCPDDCAPARVYPHLAPRMLRTTAALALEERVTRDPYALSSWLSYISHVSKQPSSQGALFCVYERAVAALPGSYKVWRAYAHAFREYASTFHPMHPARQAALDVSNRAARALRLSPVLWREYIEHLLDEARWTAVRKAANDALRVLPILQHETIWHLLMEHMVDAKDVPPRVSVLLLRRYAKLRPGKGRERLFRHLLKAKCWDQAVSHLCAALADPDWIPEGKKTREQLWMELARVAARHPKEVTCVDVPELFRGAITSAKTDVGELWVVFGEYFIRKGLFEDARNVYEDAITRVDVVRDFAVVFDAYAKFEESLVSAAMEDVEAIKDELKEAGEEEDRSKELKEANEMVELLIARLEYLTNRRPMLLSDVRLRQNPHNVHEWHKRARMFKQAKDAPNVVDTYSKAVQTVNPWRATNGRPHTLWLAFARYYEDASELESARQVLEKAVSDPEGFKGPEDLAAVWCEYAEMELRCKTPEAARSILIRATTQPDRKRREEAKNRRGESNSNAAAVAGTGVGNARIKHVYDTSSPAWNFYKSMRLWHFLIDLTQSISTTDEVLKMHHSMFDMRIASPQTVLSGASYLERQSLFEQAFRLYDKGTSVLSWPDALQVWVVYLTRFVKRFGSRKLERARDLFEEAIRSAPSTRRGGYELPHPQLGLLYIMYAEMEEEHSLARHALKVLSRAVKAVQEEDRADLYRLYIVKTATLFGSTKTRNIYEEAMSSLTRSEDVLEFAIRYAGMETRVGEIDRARGIYDHTCQVADPRRRGIYEIFWTSWNDFELSHGSEDTFRDMLRKKREVQLNHKGVIMDDDVLLNGEAIPQGKQREAETRASTLRTSPHTAEPTAPVSNTEEIQLDLDLDEDDETGRPETTEVKDEKSGEQDNSKKDEKLNIVQKELPEALKMLVGTAHPDAKRKRDEDEVETKEMNADDGKPLGALERIKRSRTNKV